MRTIACMSGADRERRRRLIQLGSATAFLAIAVILVLIVVSQSGEEGGDATGRIDLMPRKGRI